MMKKKRYRKNRRELFFVSLLILAVCLSGCGEAKPAASIRADAVLRGYSSSGEEIWDRSKAWRNAAGENADGAKENVGGTGGNTDGAKENAGGTGGNTDGAKESTGETGENADGTGENADGAKENADGTGENADAEEESADEPEVLTASSDISSIAGLGELQAGVEEELYTHSEAFVVDVENGHNPYDVEWDYGELYDAYIEEADWSLVFDADFYMESFPALAFLYHYDEELLLEHFQTVGIHEGRQGNGGFNVAAYRENCGQELRDAFGDHYECYYFYWMLNQDSQKDVAAGGGYPLQLGVKMTSMQAEEFEKVNEYRAEVGVDPLKFDPELAAVACYRGWVDISEGYGAHDWLNDEANEDRVYELMEFLHMNRLGENTVDTGILDETAHVQSTFYINYRYSPELYEAMINPDYRYFGCSHIYSGKNRIPESRRGRENVYGKPMMRVEFDLFTDVLSTPVHP